MLRFLISIKKEKSKKDHHCRASPFNLENVTLSLNIKVKLELRRQNCHVNGWLKVVSMSVLTLEWSEEPRLALIVHTNVYKMNNLIKTEQSIYKQFYSFWFLIFFISNYIILIRSLIFSLSLLYNQKLIFILLTYKLVSIITCCTLHPCSNIF